MKKKYNSKKRKPKIAANKRKTRKRPGGTTTHFSSETIGTLESLQAFDPVSRGYHCTTVDCVPSALFNIGWPAPWFSKLQAIVDSKHGVSSAAFKKLINDWNKYDEEKGCTPGRDCTVDGILFKNWTPRIINMVDSHAARLPLPTGDYHKLWTDDPAKFPNGFYKYGGFASKYGGAHAILIGKSATGKPVIIDPQELRQDIIDKEGPKIRYVWEGNAPNDFGHNEEGTRKSKNGQSWGSGIEDYFKYIAYLYDYADPSLDPKTWLKDLMRLDGGGTIEKLPGRETTYSLADDKTHEEGRTISTTPVAPPTHVTPRKSWVAEALKPYSTAEKRMQLIAKDKAEAEAKEAAREKAAAEAKRKEEMDAAAAGVEAAKKSGESREIIEALRTKWLSAVKAWRLAKMSPAELVTERERVAKKEAKERLKRRPRRDAAAKVAAEKAAREKASAEKAAREKALAEKAAREKALAEAKRKEEKEKEAKVAREKAAADKAAAEKALAEKAAAEKAAREKALAEAKRKEEKEKEATAAPARRPKPSGSVLFVKNRERARINAWLSTQPESVQLKYGKGGKKKTKKRKYKKRKKTRRRRKRKT